MDRCEHYLKCSTHNFFFLRFSNMCRIILFKILFVVIICKFRKLSIKVTYHTSPYLLEIAEDRLVGRESKASYFRLAYLIFTNYLFTWEIIGVITIIIISYHRLVSEAAVIVNYYYYHNFMNMLVFQSYIVQFFSFYGIDTLSSHPLFAIYT